MSDHPSQQRSATPAAAEPSGTPAAPQRWPCAAGVLIVLLVAPLAWLASGVSGLMDSAAHGEGRLVLGMLSAGWWGVALPIAVGALLIVAARALRIGRPWGWLLAAMLTLVLAVASPYFLRLAIVLPSSGLLPGLARMIAASLGALSGVAAIALAICLRRRPDPLVARRMLPAAGGAMGLALVLLAGAVLNTAADTERLDFNATTDGLLSAGAMVVVAGEALEVTGASAKVTGLDATVATDIVIVDSMRLRLTLQVGVDVTLDRDFRACLRANVPTREPQSADTSPALTDPCWARTQVDAAIGELLGIGQDATVTLHGGLTRELVVDLRRDAGGCDYPMGPWVLDLAVHPSGFDSLVGGGGKRASGKASR
ncbi:MAG: hypothetical protein ABIV26_06675 [Candidatus Limnocylindrales bacterium]